MKETYMNEPVTEATITKAAVAKLEKEMKFTPFANDAEITLSIAITRNMLATPTKSGKLPDDNACMRYMMMAKSRALNPFEGDCYLLGFDTQHGPKFEMIVAHQAFLKRAEIHPDFDGMESGVIVRDKETKQIEELQGDFHLDNQELLGGWAKVHHKGKKFPTYRRAKLATYRKTFGRWVEDPAGQITKVAEADALRSAFPTKLGGLYLREEIDLNPKDVQVTASNPPPPVFDMPQVEAPKAQVTNGTKTEAEEPERKTAAEVAAEPAEVKPSEGKNTEQVYAALRERMVASDVTEDMMLGYCRTETVPGTKDKFMKHNQSEILQMSDTKLRLLLDEWPQRVAAIREMVL